MPSGELHSGGSNGCNRAAEPNYDCNGCPDVGTVLNAGENIVWSSGTDCSWFTRTPERNNYHWELCFA